MARGLTLLELLVSLVILASVTTLVAALWGQMAAWSRTHIGLHEVIATARFEDLAARQWATRVTMGGTASERGRRVVSLGADELAIVTSEPLLHPSAPLVLARYRVVPSAERGVSLVYEEAPLVRADRVPRGRTDAAGSGDAREADAVRTMTVIESADDLRWQRWVSDLRDEKLIRAWFEIDEDTELSAEDIERSELDELRVEQDVSDAERDEEREGDADEEERELPPPSSVRLIGTAEGRAIQWIFTDAASR